MARGSSICLGAATVDSAGDVYVADWRNDRIQKFTPDGEFIAAYGQSGDGDGQFHRPSSVAVTDDGLICVADWGNERVQILDSDGAHRQTLYGEATLSKWAEEWLLVNPDEYDARKASELDVGELPEHLQSAYHTASQTEPYLLGAGVGEARRTGIGCTLRSIAATASRYTKMSREKFNAKAQRREGAKGRIRLLCVSLCVLRASALRTSASTPNKLS